jgi:hypothetical protein
MIKLIDVDQEAIARRDPAPINIRWDGQHVRAAAVGLPEYASVKHDYDRPQSFGARVWIETDGPVRWMDATENWHEIV